MASACANVAAGGVEVVWLEWKERGSTGQNEAGKMGRERATGGFTGLVKDFIVIPTARRDKSNDWGSSVF